MVMRRRRKNAYIVRGALNTLFNSYYGPLDYVSFSPHTGLKSIPLRFMSTQNLKIEYFIGLPRWR